MMDFQDVGVYKIHRCLAKEEHGRVEQGNLTTEESLLAFIVMGLAIEDTQYVTSSLFRSVGVLMLVVRLSIRTDAGKKDPTAPQCHSLQEHCTALLKCLRRFRQLQTILMPSLHAYLNGVLPSLSPTTDLPSHFTPLHSILDNVPHSEAQPLYLPSGLCSDDCVCVCIQGLSEIEERLCKAHVMEGLQDLQMQLQMCLFMSVYRRSNNQSQGPSTRMRTL